ncbi:MAG: copper chaperone PCu(A)C [Pseudomonadota bacterium]
MPRIPLLLLALCLAVPVAAADGHAHDDHAEHSDHDDHENHEDHANDGGHTGHDDHSDHLARLDGVEVLHAWTRATSDDSAAVYLEVRNESDAEIRISGGTTDMAASVEVFGASLTAGGDPVSLDVFPVAAGAAFAFDPGGVFLHLDGLTERLEKGADFAIALSIEPLGTLDITVEVEAANATQHSHAGHNH